MPAHREPAVHAVLVGAETPVRAAKVNAILATDLSMPPLREDSGLGKYGVVIANRTEDCSPIDLLRAVQRDEVLFSRAQALQHVHVVREGDGARWLPWHVRK